MRPLLTALLELTLLSPATLPLTLTRQGPLVTVSWPALPGQAQADVTVWRSDATVTSHTTTGAASVVAFCGDRLLVTVWDAEPRLLGTARAEAPCALWLPMVLVGRP